MRHPFKKSVIDSVWEKFQPASGENPRQKRKDVKGRIVAKAAYGNSKSEFGWNIHHRDHDKTNNSLSNLIGLNYKSHVEIHEED